MTRKKQTMFICIIGVDGAGKTTHAQKLLERLKMNGTRSKYVWSRFHHFISLLLLAYCRLIGLTIYESNGEYSISYHEFYKSKIISFLYPWILLIDMFPIYIIKIFIPLHIGYIVVCDRFVYDTLADLMIDLRDFNIHKKLVGRFFMRLIPKDSKVILLDLDDTIIRIRRKDLVYDKSLIMRRNVYNMIAKEFDIQIFENNKPIQEVHEQIAKYLEVE